MVAHRRAHARKLLHCDEYTRGPNSEGRWLWCIRSVCDVNAKNLLVSLDRSMWSAMHNGRIANPATSDLSAWLVRRRQAIPVILVTTLRKSDWRADISNHHLGSDTIFANNRCSSNQCSAGGYRLPSAACAQYATEHLLQSSKALHPPSNIVRE